MPEIFINYRTGDGEDTAALLRLEIDHRFGAGHVFHASTSINPGESFPQEILRQVQQCCVLLAVIGPTWIRSPKLSDPTDWVRREIVEALTAGATVIPVMRGRATRRLTRSELPTDLAQLADIQSWSLDPQKIGSDLGTLGDLLSYLIPDLSKADRARPASGEPEIRHDVDGKAYAPAAGDTTASDHSTITRADHGATISQGGIHHVGDRNTTIGGAGNPYVEGDIRGGFSQNFGTPQPPASEGG
jgi:hypothetical protein